MWKESDLDFIVTHIRQNMIDLLIHPDNGFKRREYMAVCHLLWFIDNFPFVKISPIRIGLAQTIGNNLLEWIIHYDDDVLKMGLEGIERTNAGSDSFERYYNVIDHPVKIDELDLNIDFESFEVWFKEFQWLLNEDELIIPFNCQSF